MELVRGLHNIREQHKGCVLTIGKFDGVHLGHQAVLKNLVKQAKNLRLPATVMVFEPQPEEVFDPQNAPARLSRLRDKYEQLKALGVDRLLCIRFDQNFSRCSAEDFIENLLIEKLGVKFLVVGDDFRFGQKRLGNFTMLEKYALQHQFALVSTQSFRHHDCRISSTEIRLALEQGEFGLVKEMLGRDFTISGKVVHGEKKGRTIGFPTANVLLKRCKAPINGVFAVKVNIDARHYDGVANVGTRPTLDGEKSQLEVHLFDFEQHIYGKRISVAFIKKLRDEKKFDSFELLHEQIILDAQAAKALMSVE
ncbi:MAG: bifunctional riboflavin kinase/FAD synthetase [Aliiglaciecola sp.]|uniref:bifunctional riboflavin kinase/FAD synthetase n=1 Tax=Aliiglaciecola sp. M165 TaxID=2593649 RepID=UPI00117E86EA|nr:bifunctional riboflavin kinase/FAD synthetase [Aliiglaciecola sp. M165]TRY29592.1 bifunctional riboflavin kinase/FAD synthetase [Aliiglaciecola sp. M165]